MPFRAVDGRDLATQGAVEALRVSTDAHFVAVRGEIAEMRGEMRASIAELRGDLRSQLPKLIAANIASGIGLVSLTIAAAKLL